MGSCGSKAPSADEAPRQAASTAKPNAVGKTETAEVVAAHGGGDKKQEEAAVKMQAATRGKVGRDAAAAKKAIAQEDESRNNAATKMQAAVRGKKDREEVDRMTSQRF